MAENTSPLLKLSSFQWTDVIKFLTADEFKNLRLAGNKSMGCLMDPSMTSHLQLRVDKAPFFRIGDSTPEGLVKKWLQNRDKLIIDDNFAASICPSRLATLVQGGFLDSVTQVVVFGCRFHRKIISELSKLPNIEALKLVDEGDSMDELERIVLHVGNMHTLKNLDIEFDCVIDGSRLSFLDGLRQLKNLRLRGFDLSAGLHHIGHLKSLDSIHLCHGNFYSSPCEDVNEKDLIHLGGSANVTDLHLEGFDCLSGAGLQPLCSPGSLKHIALKHCQELSEDILQNVGRLLSLESFHVVLSAYDDGPIFETEDLRYLNSLAALKSLSLFYVLEDPYDLTELRGLTALETLNIAFDEGLDENEVDELCEAVLPILISLRKIRIFSEESMEYSIQCRGLEVEFAQFNFGDLVYLD